MDIDTHVHLLISKTAKPDWAEIAFTTEVAVTEGLHVICVAEHRDALHYSELIEGLFFENKLGGELIEPGMLSLPNGSILSSAAEIALKGGGDVGVHASPEVLLSLRPEKAAYSLEELLAELHPHRHDVTVIAHHVFWKNKGIAELRQCAGLVDGLELPAKDLAQEVRYRALADELGLALVGGGDAHTWPQVGQCRNQLLVDSNPHFNRSVLKSAIRERDFTVVHGADVVSRVRLANMLRKRMVGSSMAGS